MNLLNQAAELFLSNLQGNNNNLDSNQITNALQNLLPTDGSDIDFTALISQFTNGNLTDLIGSFLGDGANMNMMASQIISMFGEEKIIGFATALGLSAETASEILSNIIPNLIDQNSQGGNVTQLAGKLLGNLFG